jgi:molybdopterin-guanine dinucleotide biosynthesis protein A
MEINAMQGLVLAGGRSKRMGRDKASLSMNGKALVTHVVELTKQVCSQVFISLRPGQEDTLKTALGGAMPIHDQYGEIGPLGGILSALNAYPDTPWLVLAVDLPHLDRHTLEYLIMHRDSGKPFTAYRGRDDLPEPLCAIYEPQSRAILMDHFNNTRSLSPRKIFIEERAHLLSPPNPGALTNVNTPEEFEEALKK